MDQLLSDDRFSEVITCLRGRVWGIYSRNGNVGDRLISEGTRQLLLRNSIEAYPINGHDGEEEYEGLIIGGGGFLCGMYGAEWHVSIMVDRAVSKMIPVVVLPHSLLNPPKVLGSVRVFARDHFSADQIQNATLAPDMALALSTELNLPAPSQDVGIFLRRDRESVFSGNHNDPVRFVCYENWEGYIKLASVYSRIITDRLHFAIAGLMARVSVTLCPNSYHKNRGMFDSWLRDLGCEWCENPTNFRRKS